MRVLALALGALFLSTAAYADPVSSAACLASPQSPAGARVVACGDVIRSGTSLYAALVARAAAYEEEGAGPDAIADLSAAVAIDPDRADAYAARGRIYLKQEEFRDGLVDLDRALTIAPDDEDTLRTRAFAWDTLGNYPAAIGDYSTLLTLTGDPGYRYFRGFAYLRHDDDDAALADFEAIIGSDSPTLSAWGYRGRGQVHEKRGELAAALADYDAALAADPDDDRAYAGRCRVESALGQAAHLASGCTAAVITARAP